MMEGKSYCFVLLSLLAAAGPGLAFTPNTIRLVFLSSNLDDATHTSITKAGVKRALRQYFLEKNPGYSPPPISSSSEAVNWSPLDSVGLNIDRGLIDVFRIQYGTGCVLNLKPYQSAIEEIIAGNTKTDTDAKMKDRADFHFDAEKFNESNANVIAMREKAKTAVARDELRDAREAFGIALHPIQDFYSHSNWVEMGGKGPNPGLGNSDGFGLPVAGPNVRTCKPCQNALGDCVGNVVVTDQLTSGYFRSSLPGNPVESDAEGKPVLKPENGGKCSHGGPFDQSANDAPIGGINKDTSQPSASPHWYLHRQAADAAELATADFVTAFRREVGDKQFDKFLALEQVQCRPRRKRRSVEVTSHQLAAEIAVTDESSTRTSVMRDHLSPYHPVLLALSVWDLSKKPLVIPIDSTLEDFVIKVAGAGPVNEAVSLTSPSNVIYTFDTTSENGSIADVQVQAPEPGLWRLEGSRKDAKDPRLVTVLGSSSWDAVINVMVVVERMHHVKRLRLGVVKPGEPLYAGSTIYVYVMAPVESASIQQLDLQGMDGVLIKHMLPIGQPAVEDGFARHMFEVVVPVEQFRLVVRAKDQNNYDLMRTSGTVYGPGAAESDSKDNSVSPSEQDANIGRTEKKSHADSALPLHQGITVNVATLTCVIVFLWLLAILVVILLKVAADRYRSRRAAPMYKGDA